MAPKIKVSFKATPALYYCYPRLMRYIPAVNKFKKCISYWVIYLTEFRVVMVDHIKYEIER